MNIKVIIGLMLMVFIGFTSCSEETVIGEPPYETGTFTLSFSMNEETQTKATVTSVDPVLGPAEGYHYSTESELKVNNCFIAIFAKDDENGWSKKILADSYTPISEGIGSFKVSGLVLPIKTDLKIVAIANLPSDKIDAYRGKSYAELEGATIVTSITNGAPYYTFDPSSLIKVGQREVRFNAKGNLINDKDEEISDKTTIIPLTQLAAKIYLNLEVVLPTSESSEDVKEGEFFGDYPADDVLNKFTKNGMNSATSVGSSAYIIVDNDGRLKQVTDQKPDDYLASAYQCGKGTECPTGYVNGTNKKFAHVTGLVKKQITTIADTYLFNPNSLIIKNIETSSSLLLPEGQLQSSNCVSVTVTDKAEGVTNVRFVFYTYQKPYYSDENNEQVLAVNLEGSLSKGNLVKTEVWKPKGGIHAIWNDKNGWGEGNSNFKYDYKLDDQPSEIVESTENMTSVSNSSFNFEIKINPNKGTEGIVHGNYYEVTGRLIMNKSSVTLEYEVVNEEPIKVDIVL